MLCIIVLSDTIIWLFFSMSAFDWDNNNLWTVGILLLGNNDIMGVVHN